jgi:hypothetical protein
MSHNEFESKKESIVEYKLGRFLKTKVSIEPIIPQNLYVIPNNKVMSMEHIFQYINK